ncbi:MAG: hypothetical protein JRN59_06635 [Nitrososphaerota archaeon]|nr:hypothetical protein [Nitrososphaerota archaeon]
MNPAVDRLWRTNARLVVNVAVFSGAAGVKGQLGYSSTIWIWSESGASPGADSRGGLNPLDLLSLIRRHAS